MKQKNGQVKTKSNLNGVQKQKNNKKMVEAALNGKNIKAAKKQLKEKTLQEQPKKKPIPPKKVEDDDEEMEDESNSENDFLDNEAVEEEEEDSDEEGGSDGAQENSDEAEDDDSDEEENNGIGEENDTDDDEPVEKPISKKDDAPAKGRTTKINTGGIPKDYPEEQVIVVKNLPKKFKQIDIVEVFAKYGVIEIINTEHTAKGSKVLIAFTTAEAAQAALVVDNKATIKGSTIRVTIENKNLKKREMAEKRKKATEEFKQRIELNKDLTIYVKNIQRTTTEEQIREHFTSCGAIQSIVARPHHSYALVCFTNSAEVEAAKKLHNSVLNGSTIGVFLKDDDHSKHGDVKCTIMLKNKQQFESLPVDKLEKIFSKCGEIENIDILCRKTVLAFVTFKQDKSVKKAMKLTGTTSEGIELDISEYKSREQLRTSVFVQNVKPGTTEEEIRELFATCGPIANVMLKHGFAVLKFEDVDGFCKSFLKNESLLQGQMIFLEPFSDKKKEVLRKQKGAKKRPRPFNGAKFNAKRAKKE